VGEGYKGEKSKKATGNKKTYRTIETKSNGNFQRRGDRLKKTPPEERGDKGGRLRSEGGKSEQEGTSNRAVELRKRRESRH